MLDTATRNLFGSLKRDVQEITGVDTDVDGQFTITFTGLRRVLDGDPANVEAQCPDGFVINVASVSGNTVTFELYQGGGADTELAANTGGSSVTDIHATAIGE